MLEVFGVFFKAIPVFNAILIFSSWYLPVSNRCFIPISFCIAYENFRACCPDSNELHPES